MMEACPSYEGKKIKLRRPYSWEGLGHEPMDGRKLYEWFRPYFNLHGLEEPIITVGMVLNYPLKGFGRIVAIGPQSTLTGYASVWMEFAQTGLAEVDIALAWDGRTFRPHVLDIGDEGLVQVEDPIGVLPSNLLQQVITVAEFNEGEGLGVFCVQNTSNVDSTIHLVGRVVDLGYFCDFTT